MDDRHLSNLSQTWKKTRRLVRLCRVLNSKFLLLEEMGIEYHFSLIKKRKNEWILFIYLANKARRRCWDFECLLESCLLVVAMAMVNGEFSAEDFRKKNFSLLLLWFNAEKFHVREEVEEEEEEEEE